MIVFEVVEFGLVVEHGVDVPSLELITLVESIYSLEFVSSCPHGKQG
jgi:hypothetical protein